MTDLQQHTVMERQNEAADFEHHLRPIFDGMFEGIQILDAEWRYVYLNTTAAQHGRIARDELLGRRMLDVYPGIEHTEMFDRLQQCMAARTPQSMVNEFVYPDGSKAWFNLRMNPVPMGVLVLSIDITSEKRTEEQLRDVQKMEAVGRLAGGVAHDFNNLLTVITGYSDLVLRDMATNDRFRDELEEIHQASQRASALTRQLLAFSRRQRLHPEVVDPNRIVERMDRMLRRLIGENIDLVTRAKPDVGNVLADPGQLEQIVMNLALNARDAMPHGGMLTIETDAVELDAAYARLHPDAVPGPHVMIAVSDTGSGMDDATKSRIFEPFFTTKESGRGTGLGLSTVYGIVKQSGGNIWVYSEPGRGTTFKVYLPHMQEAGDAVVRETVPAGVMTGTETVLVVEDDDAVRGYVCNVLRGAGYTILSTGNPDEAVDLATRPGTAIQLLLTDVVLPRTGGRELAGRITAERPDMRVIFMSGYTDDAIIHRGALEERTAFVDKPIAPDLLLAMLRTVLESTASHG